MFLYPLIFPYPLTISQSGIFEQENWLVQEVLLSLILAGGGGADKNCMYVWFNVLHGRGDKPDK